MSSKVAHAAEADAARLVCGAVATITNTAHLQRQHRARVATAVASGVDIQ